MRVHLLIVFLTNLLLLSCMPQQPEESNPQIQRTEPTVDVALSIASWQQDDLSQLVLTGHAEGVPTCDQCDGGYLTSLPFGPPSGVLVGVTGGGRNTQVITQPQTPPGGESFYRYSYVDENGYTNSAVARYQNPDSEKAVTLYHQPASENDPHLVFTAVLQEPLDDPDNIEIKYLGNEESEEPNEGGNVKLGCNSCITSEPTTAGGEEIRFKVELDEADDDVEGLEYAPFEVTFPASSGLPTLNFRGIILDDDRQEPLVTKSPPPVLDLQKMGSCPSSQSDRLGSGGDVRFSLQWENPHADLNLWVKDPCGNVNNQLSSAHQCGDHTSTRETTEGHKNPSENILWSAGAEIGEYAFAIEHFSGPETEFTLCVYRNGGVEGYQGTAGGGAISDIQSTTVNISDIGHFTPALASQFDEPDFDYTGEVADPLPIINFTAEPVTVVQTVDGDEPRAEFQFQFDVLNLSNQCQGQFLQAHIIDEEGNRREALVVGNSTYKMELSEGRDEVLDLAYIPPSHLIHFSPGELESRRWNIDVPMSDAAKSYQVELTFHIEAERPPRDFYVHCLSQQEEVPEIRSATVQIDVPGQEDIDSVNGGPNVEFAYPYVTRPYEGITYSHFVNDTVFLQHIALPSTDTPDDVELHINRELYRRGVPFSAEEPVKTEFNGWFVLEGVDIDFRTYYAPVEFRYMYPREFKIRTKQESRTARYTLAKSSRVDILGAFSSAPIQVDRDTLIYFDGAWDDHRDAVSFNQDSVASLPTVIHFANYVGLYRARGSAANDVYHVQRDLSDDPRGGSVVVEYSEDATNGFDILSFSPEVDMDYLEYYRRGDDLWIVKKDFLDQDWIQTLLDEYSGSVGAVLDEIASDSDYSTYKNPHFRVVVERYFGDSPRLIDEFHWNNELYITHEEILDQVIEF